MTEKEIKQHLLEQVQEKGYNIIYFDYDREYDLLYVIEQKYNTPIIFKKVYCVDNMTYDVQEIDSSIAYFMC